MVIQVDLKTSPHNLNFFINLILLFYLHSLFLHIDILFMIGLNYLR